MKLRFDGGDSKKIILNQQQTFRTDSGWDESFQQYEDEVLKDIINPIENYETCRYIHKPYTSSNNIYQTDIWFYFYFLSGGTYVLDYTPQGLDQTTKLLADVKNSFFRLEFYKTPNNEPPNRSNRRLVFAKNLSLPIGEKSFIESINSEMYVPVFMGSNYKNKENMYLFWFEDDTVLEESTLTGTTFFMTAKFYNAVDGSRLQFANKQISNSSSLIEEDDLYFEVQMDRSNAPSYNYDVSDYNSAGTVRGNRRGTSSSPINFYEIGGTGTTTNPTPTSTPTVTSCRNMGSTPYTYTYSASSATGACDSTTSVVVYTTGELPITGVVLYSDPTGCYTASPGYYAANNSYMVVDQYGEITLIGTCFGPTPTTPTIYELGDISNGTLIKAWSCTGTTSSVLYSNKSDFNTVGAGNSTYIYTDTNGTVLVGNNLWYGITSSSGLPTKTIQVSNSGLVTDDDVCNNTPTISWTNGTTNTHSYTLPGDNPSTGTTTGTVTVTNGPVTVYIIVSKGFNYANTAVGELTISGVGSISIPAISGDQSATSITLSIPTGIYPYTIKSILTIDGGLTAGQMTTTVYQQ